MTFSSRMSGTAERLLTAYGTSISVSRTTSSDYNTVTGDVTEATTTYSGFGNPDTFNFQEIDNVNILSTDIKLLFRSDTAPLVGDIITLRYSTYRVLNVGIAIAQDTDILYTLQLRK